ITGIWESAHVGQNPVSEKTTSQMGSRRTRFRGSGRESHRHSKPGLVAVVEVGLPELLAQDLGFLVGSKDVHRYQQRVNCVEPIEVQDENQAENHDIGENVDGIPNSRI